MRILRFGCILVLSGVGELAAQASPHAAESGQDGEIVYFLLSLVAVMVAAKLGGELLERLHQPAVLGELIVGMALGSLGMLGIPFLEGLKYHRGLQTAAEIGVILLLFEVGLESHLGEMLRVGLSAVVVACLGVIAPVALGYTVSAWFLSSEPWFVHLFVGGTLAATSVGITARVLRDLKRIETIEARIILGAAVVDDVLGLIILAVLSGLVSSLSGGDASGLAIGLILGIVVKALLFLAGAIFAGRFLHINAVRLGARFRVPGIPLVIAVCHCFLFAALAGQMGLAPIVGAFAAGLVLEPSDYEVYQRRGEQPIEQLIRPLSTILTPVFFVMMGLRVDVRAFASTRVLAFAGLITLVAVIGKQVCAFGVFEKRASRIAVGVGMIPRGEVGLIFTGIAASQMVAGRPVFSADTVSAMVVMVIVTTLLTPPLLKSLMADRT